MPPPFSNRHLLAAMVVTRRQTDAAQPAARRTQRRNEGGGMEVRRCRRRMHKSGSMGQGGNGRGSGCVKPAALRSLGHPAAARLRRSLLPHIRERRRRRLVCALRLLAPTTAAPALASCVTEVLLLLLWGPCKVCQTLLTFCPVLLIFRASWPRGLHPRCVGVRSRVVQQAASRMSRLPPAWHLRHRCSTQAANSRVQVVGGSA